LVCFQETIAGEKHDAVADNFRRGVRNGLKCVQGRGTVVGVQGQQGLGESRRNIAGEDVRRPQEEDED
jgi:hypothetical protein